MTTTKTAMRKPSRNSTARVREADAENAQRVRDQSSIHRGDG